MTDPRLDWPAVRACAATARDRAGRALAVAGWWTLGAIALWVLSQFAMGWLMDRIAPLPDPDQVAQAQDIASPLALLVTVAVRLAGVGVQLAVFCALPLPALYGMAWMCVRAIREEPVAVHDMRGPMRHASSFAGVVALLALAVVVPFMLWALAIVIAGVIITAQAMSEGVEGLELTIRVWWTSVALAVPFVLSSVWIQCRWIYAPLAVADGAGVWEAMRMSWRITRSGSAMVWARIAGAMLGWTIAPVAMLALPLAWIGLPRVAAYFAAGYVLGRDVAHRAHAGSAHGSQ
jgi:hypothetical protein